MKSNSTRKFLCVLLAMLLVVAMVPATVFAATPAVKIYDSTGEALFNPLYTYDSATGTFTIQLEEPAAGSEYRYLVDAEIDVSIFPPEYGVTAEYMYDIYNEEYEMYEDVFELREGPTTTVPEGTSSFTVAKNKTVYLFYCPKNATEYNRTETKHLILHTESNGSIYGGADRNGTDVKFDIDTTELNKIFKDGKLVDVPETDEEFEAFMETLAKAIKVPDNATYHTGGDGFHLFIYDEENDEYVDIYSADEMVADGHYFYQILLFGPSEGQPTTSQANLVVTTEGLEEWDENFAVAWYDLGAEPVEEPTTPPTTPDAPSTEAPKTEVPATGDANSVLPIMAVMAVAGAAVVVANKKRKEN